MSTGDPTSPTASSLNKEESESSKGHRRKRDSIRDTSSPSSKRKRRKIESKPVGNPRLLVATNSDKEESEGERRKGKTRDPRSLAASSLDRETFQLQYPFIQLRDKVEVQGKFSRKERMDPEVLCCFMNYIHLTLEVNKGIWYGVDRNPTNGELATRPQNLIFFGSLCHLSKSYLEFKKRKGKGSKNQEEDYVSHIQVPDVPTTSKDVSATNSGSSTEEVLLNHEGKINKGTPDIMVKIIPKRFLSDNKLEHFDPDIVKVAVHEKILRTIAIIEFKDDGEIIHRGAEVGLFQAVAYAIDLVMENINIHKDKPIYLLVCGNSKWFFGVLKVKSCVSIGDTGLLEADASKDNSSLFELRTNELRKYMGDENVHYSGGQYAVGELSIVDKLFVRTWSYKEPHHDNYFFIQSLLRLMLGDSVMQINGDDAREVIKITNENRMMISKSIEVFAHVHKFMMQNWYSYPLCCHFTQTGLCCTCQICVLN